jgi:hypothetical protein
LENFGGRRNEMQKLLAVYNICGINGGAQTDLYISRLRSMLDQDLDGVQVALSSCMSSPEQIQDIRKEFGDRLVYNSIHEVLPISVTFNHTVQQCIKKFGDFEGYLYVDSGIDFLDSATHFKSLYDLFKSGPYSMVAARTSDDTGWDDWYVHPAMKQLGLHPNDMRGKSLFKNGHVILPVGTATNLHVQIFSHKLLEAYNNILPDIFASYCIESTFTFMCAAINTKWIVHKDVILNHWIGMEGRCQGFRNNPKFGGWDHLFCTSESISEILSRGLHLGMGYEEMRNVAIHDPNKFDEEGYAKDERLSSYIRDNMFLRPAPDLSLGAPDDWAPPVAQFDYNNIKHTCS